INKGLNAFVPRDTLDLDNDSDVTEAVPYDQRVTPPLQTNITDASVAALVMPFRRIVNTDVDIGAFEYTSPPLPNAGAAGYVVNEGANLSLDGGGSSDPSGTILWYEVDYNYDGLAFSADDSGTSAVFAKTASDGPFTQTAALRVTDEFGQTAIATAPV